MKVYIVEFGRLFLCTPSVDKKTLVTTNICTHYTEVLVAVNLICSHSMELVNSAQAAVIMGVSDQTFLNWIKKGRIDGVSRVGRIWLIPRESLETLEHPKQGRPRTQSTDSKKGQS